MFIVFIETIGGSRKGPGGPGDPGGPAGPDPIFEYQKSIATACQRGTKALPGNNARLKLSLATYEFLSSSPTFSDTDLAQAIYLASRGSPKLFLALSVTSFIDSLHTPRMNVIWGCLSLIDVLGAVV